jgi:cyclopropane-fatty-acyl-phospholipid synthase
MGVGHVSPPREGTGASKRAITAHYDVGNRFYSLWLDASMTYSAGLWNDTCGLEDAQRRKLDLHIEWSQARADSNVLDVGCGWGSLLRRLGTVAKCSSIVGLTLSDEQAKYVRDLGLRDVQVIVESWREHRPSIPYDAIVSIGALEHFVRPETPDDERVQTYSEFFARCREWSKEDSFLSLQTIAYESGSFIKGAIASIFPESDLPRRSQIEEGVRGSYEIVELRNDPTDYARTCREWLRRLRRRRTEAIRLVGDATTGHFEAFLDAAARGFDSNVFALLRLRLRRL